MTDTEGPIPAGGDISAEGDTSGSAVSPSLSRQSDAGDTGDTGIWSGRHWTADVLMRTEFPPPKMAVPGLICEGLNVLAGPPKVGKSWLTYGLALAVAAGGQALGNGAPVTAGSVLMLALEDTGRRLQERLDKLLPENTPAPSNLHLVTECETLPSGGAARICAWLESHTDARLVIIDVLQRIRGAVPGSKNAYEADYAAMSQLKKIADHYSVAVIAVTHTRKMTSGDFLSDVSGTNGIAGAADATLVLRRSRGEADAELNITGRDVEEATYAMRFTPETGAWQMIKGPAIDHLVGGTRAAILKYLRERPGDGPGKIAFGTDVKLANVKQTLGRMVRDGQLTTNGRGCYYAADAQGDIPLSPVSPVSLSQVSAGDTTDSQVSPSVESVAIEAETRTLKPRRVLHLVPGASEPQVSDPAETDTVRTDEEVPWPVEVAVPDVHPDQLQVPGTPTPKPTRNVRPKCGHCRKAIPKTMRADSKWCGKSCQQKAYKARAKAREETS